MTDALLRLSCAVNKASDPKRAVSPEAKEELRRAFIAALPAIDSAEIPVTPVDRLDAALADCLKAGVSRDALGERMFGTHSLVTLFGRG